MTRIVLALANKPPIPSQPSIALATTFTIGATIVITPGAGGGPVASFAEYLDGVASGRTVAATGSPVSYTIVGGATGDIGPSVTFKAVGPGGPSAASNALQFAPSAAWTGLFISADAVDNGTTQSVPNRIGGGAAMVATGAGRPALVADAICSGVPGLLTTGSTKALLFPSGLSGQSGFTILQVSRSDAANPGLAGVGKAMWDLADAADANEQAYCYWGQPTLGRTEFHRVGSADIKAVGKSNGGTANTGYEPLVFPVVMAYASDLSELPKQYREDQELPEDPTGSVPITGTLGARTYVPQSFYGAAGAGSNVFGGWLGACAVIKGILSQAEIATAAQYIKYLLGIPRISDYLITGDSRVACNIASSAQWRKIILDQQDALPAASQLIRCVGPFAYNPGSSAATPFQRDFGFGAGGAKVGDLTTWLTTYTIDRFKSVRYCPIMIGINDIIASAAPATIAANMQTMLTAFAATLPAGCKFALYTVPTDPSGAWVSACATLNGLLPGVVATARGAGIDVTLKTTLTDGTVTLTWLGDQLHYSATCETALATALHADFRGMAA